MKEGKSSSLYVGELVAKIESLEGQMSDRDSLIDTNKQLLNQKNALLREIETVTSKASSMEAAAREEKRVQEATIQTLTHTQEEKEAIPH